MADSTIIFPAPGKTHRGLLAATSPTLAGYEWPYLAIRGVADGPTLCVIAGIHGAEYPPIDAVLQFSRAIDPATLRGQILAVPIVNLPAFWARTPFVCPADGKNPNRAFPGDPHGSFSQALAHLVFEQLIKRGDFLVDLHCGDLVEDLVPYCGMQESGIDRVDRSALDLAVTFGLPYVCAEPPTGGSAAGTTDGAAAAAGIPAIYAEAGGIGQLRQSDVDLHLRGLHRVLMHLGMVDGDQDTLNTPTMLREVVVVRAARGGFFRKAVAAGDTVQAGGLIGRMVDLWGEPQEEITSPVDGVALFVTTSPAISAEGLLIGIGVPG
jgi:uncharacterized protein